MRYISTLRNLLQPANRLPPEIISHVVQYIPEESARDPSSIIPVTHVCRHWRDSIVSTPNNWTRISSERIGLAELSLERCGVGSVEMWFDISQAGITPGFFDSITPHLQNTRVLGVKCSPTKNPSQTLQKILPLTPNLQSLSLLDCGGNSFNRPKDPCGQLTSSLNCLDLSGTLLYPSLLGLRTLTSLKILDHSARLHLDTLLDFVEENRALEYANLNILFNIPSLQNARPRLPIKNRLRNLSIAFECTPNLLSKIAVQEGAHVYLHLLGKQMEYLPPFVSMGPLSNLRSPTCMKYCPDEVSTRTTRLLGPNGSFSLKVYASRGTLFEEFPLLPLSDIRTFHFDHRSPGSSQPRPTPTVPLPLSFPALETLVIERATDVSLLLSSFFSNQSSTPPLRTLAFFDCQIGEGFMKELTRFSSDRKNTALVRLGRVVIVNSNGQLPHAALIDELEKHVSVVDVRVGWELPPDLRWNGQSANESS